MIEQVRARAARPSNKHGSRTRHRLQRLAALHRRRRVSGESDIRQWIIENDWLEAIVALPEQMFYNTGIGTYIWIVTNRKEKRRKGKIQLLDARDVWTAGGSEDNKRSLGDKRRHMTDQPDRRDRPALRRGQADGETSKIFDNADFGYTRVTVERPAAPALPDDDGGQGALPRRLPALLDDVQAIDKALGREPQLDWNAVWAASRRCCDARESRWKATEQKLFRSVFTPEGPGGRAGAKAGATRATSRMRTCAISRTCRSRTTSTPTSSARCARTCPTPGWTAAKDKVGYEINFNRHFYKYTPPRAAGGDRCGAEAGGGGDHVQLSERIEP